MKSTIPISIIALSVGMYFLYISPTLSEIKGLGLKKAEYDTVLAKAKEISEKRDAIRTQYNNIPEEEITKLNKIIPTNHDFVIFVNDINNLAAQYGLTIKNMKDTSSNSSDTNRVLAEGEKPPSFKTNIVTMTLSGSYDAFVKFLYSAESSLRLMDVKALSIKYVTDQKSNLVGYTFNLEVLVYSLN